MWPSLCHVWLEVGGPFAVYVERVGGPPYVTFDGRVDGPPCIMSGERIGALPCVMSSQRVGDRRMTYMWIGLVGHHV